MVNGIAHITGGGFDEKCPRTRLQLAWLLRANIVKGWWNSLPFSKLLEKTW